MCVLFHALILFNHLYSVNCILQSREGSRVEDKRFNVAVSHNNNSSSGGGARARVPNPHINNPRGANPRVRNPVSSNPQQILGQNKHKTNNRNKQGLVFFHFYLISSQIYSLEVDGKSRIQIVGFLSRLSWSRQNYTFM